jgi:hypothetical protein
VGSSFAFVGVFRDVRALEMRGVIFRGVDETGRKLVVLEKRGSRYENQHDQQKSNDSLI